MIGRDGIAALVVLVASAALFALTLSLRDNPFVPIGPGFYPRVVLGVTAVLALALLVSDVVQRRGRAPVSPRPPSGYRRVALLFAVFGIYVATLPLLGFRLASFAFLVVAQCTIDAPGDRRRWIALVGVALVTTVIAYLVFERYLSVLLPRGRWTGF